jgi:hypothetical protein
MFSAIGSSTGHRKPLAFYSISFGCSRYTSVLRTMAQIARDVYRTAAVSIRQIPCEYRNALDTVSEHHLGFDRGLYGIGATGVHLPRDCRVVTTTESGFDS